MQNFQALGNLLPDPRVFSGWRLCPQTPRLLLTSSCWRLRPQTPKTAPYCEFHATRLFERIKFFKFRQQKKNQIAQPTQPLLYLHVNLKTRLTAGILGLIF